MLQLTAFLFVSTDQQTGKIFKEEIEPNYIFLTASFFYHNSLHVVFVFISTHECQAIKKIHNISLLLIQVLWHVLNMSDKVTMTKED